MLSAEHHARYWWAAQAVSGLRVLDAGCGDGSGAEILARAGAEEVVGVDVAPEAVSTAMERYESVATFTLGDVTALPFDAESFDVVVGFEVIEHVADQSRALQGLRRVLRPEGMLLVSASNPSISAGKSAQPLTSCELSEELRRLFGHVWMLQQTDWFMSAVVEHSDDCSSDISRALPVELLKGADMPVDRGGAAVALASTVPLADLPLGVGVACSPGGPEEQLRRNILLQLELERAFTREKALRSEHDALGERLWRSAERNQIELARAAADLDRARRTVVEMQASLSWRLTRPLRGLGGLLRRRS
ncbi:MAG: class I SAM-dependent methyltransferase [Actinobacteria bacterium]|nr:class I SAM-dependent methyltransferase [Actinomycetota bacterium]